jgi:hypothetical protein
MILLTFLLTNFANVNEPKLANVAAAVVHCMFSRKIKVFFQYE